MKNAFWLSLIIIWSVGAATLKAGDWPQFRGKGGMGISTEPKVPVRWSQDENLVWKIELPGAGASAPIVFNNRVYITCFSGFGVSWQEGGSFDDLTRHLLCIDPKDGKVVWETHTPAQFPEQNRMREDHGYASNTPAADALGVCVFHGRSGVIAFDHQGKQQWKADVGKGLHEWGSGASLVLWKDLLFVNASVESEALIALNRKTGKEVWRAEGIRESWNTPILVDVKGGKQELVVAMLGWVLGFDPATGRQLWKCATEIGWYMVPSLSAADGVVYVIGGRTGDGFAVRAGGKGDVSGTHVLWRMKKGSNVTSPIFHEGYLYWMHENDETAYCADGKTGEIVYQERIPRIGQVYAPAVLGNGNLYYLSRDGKTAVIAATPKFKQLGFNDLSDRTPFNAGAAIAGGRMYIRSDRYLYCVGE